MATGSSQPCVGQGPRAAPSPTPPPSPTGTASRARLAGPHQYVWMGRQRRTCGTKNGEDLYETKVGYPMEGGCRDENEIRKRERCSSTTARTFVKSTHSLNSSDVMKITMQFGPLVTFHTTPWPSLKLIRAPPSNLLVNFAKKKNFTKFNPWSSLSLIHFYKSNLKVS